MFLPGVARKVEVLGAELRSNRAPLNRSTRLSHQLTHTYFLVWASFIGSGAG